MTVVGRSVAVCGGGAGIDVPLVDGEVAAGDVGVASVSPADVLVRLAEAEDTLRAIGAGEVDAFVLPDGAAGHRVFSLETADRPYRIFVENMRDGAATVSSTGVILFANRRLAELLSCARDTIVGSLLSRFLAGDAGSFVGGPRHGQAKRKTSET